MLTYDVAPALRALGLLGSGTTYSIPSDTHWALVGFQGSTSNTAEVMKFTINVKVVRRDVWRNEYTSRPYIGRTPTANTHVGSFEWSERIGLLMPARADHWWSLRLGQDVAPIAAEVIEALSTYAIPAMTAQIAATT